MSSVANLDSASAVLAGNDIAKQIDVLAVRPSVGDRLLATLKESLTNRLCCLPHGTHLAARQSGVSCYLTGCIPLQVLFIGSLIG
jgi:hypothetical protein